MKTIQNNMLFGAGLSLMTLAILFAGVAQVHAESPNILVGPDLSLGSSNQNVVVLQGLLSEMGYLQVPTGIPLGYYGSMTRNAVGSYQSRLGVSPTAGYYGALTKDAMRRDYDAHGWLDLLDWN